MIPQYEYVITGFLFGLIVALDVMCLVNIISAILRKRKLNRQREMQELQKLARHINYEDLPLKYKKLLKGVNNVDERKE